LNNIRFIVNPKSGVNRNPRRIVRWIRKICHENKIEHELVFTGNPGHATDLAYEAVEKGFDIVAVVGGDGTMNEVGRGLVNSKVAMAVIPSGSGNGFARNFKIPLQQYNSIKMLISPRIITIDTGRINKHPFFNVAGFGLDANISQNFEEFGIRGPLPYFLVGTRSFLNFQPQSVVMTFDNEKLEISPLVVTIANAPEYGNGAIIAPVACPDDGMLDITVLDYMPVWKAAANLYRLFNGTIDQIEEFHSYRVKSMMIERPAPGPIQTDGNPHQEEAELQVEIVPSSLRVVVGQHYSNPRR
jgi:diacylglycerol kinase (ATP)